jgi:aquaporin Z
VSIPVDNTSVNPARSTGPALFVGTEALSQLWVFWLAPLVGGLIAGATYIMLFGKDVEAVPLPEATEA